MSATVTAAPPVVEPAVAAPPPPPVVPRVSVVVGRQRIGCFISIRVEGEPVWLVWRAVEPTEDERQALEEAARAGVAGRGAWPMADLTAEALTYFAGAAPMVVTETLTVDAPKTAVAGAATTYTGEYTGADPAELDFWFDAGVRSAAVKPVIGSGKWSFETVAPAAGQHTLSVKVPGEYGAMGVSAIFVTTVPPVVVAPVVPAAAKPIVPPAPVSVFHGGTVEPAATVAASGTVEHPGTVGV